MENYEIYYKTISSSTLQSSAYLNDFNDLLYCFKWYLFYSSHISFQLLMSNLL